MGLTAGQFISLKAWDIIDKKPTAGLLFQNTVLFTT
jgi:hypothetical protein